MCWFLPSLPLDGAEHLKTANDCFAIHKIEFSEAAEFKK